ncbi:MAG: DUF423 domain-containing protein [Chloroflexota bacterium]|nr:DUF423 domain-containing protein [Chloroflexota bacterium]
MIRSPAIIAIAAIFGLLAVIAGAAGTHALRDTLDAGALRTFETAARFQMYHALALLAVGLLAMRWQTRALTISAALFTLGTILFSGSLYILALSGIGIFGAVAPVGGLCLMAGWASLVYAALRSR